MLWLSFIRRARTFNVNACQGNVCGGIAGGGYDFSRSLHLIQRQIYTNWKSNSKMLKSFEECVFQPINKKFTSSSMDYLDNNKLAAATTRTPTIPTHFRSDSTKTADMKGRLMESNGMNNNSYDIDYRERQYSEQDYEEAVKALNSLQSNAETLRSSIHNMKRLNSLQETEKYLIRSGLSVKDLETMSVVHVAGTKGKGSTCALVESILRHYGVKTGFYSSPHLVSLTERIRLNGQPITKQLFTHYFWRVYNPLKAHQEDDTDMPGYFKFLTIMALHLFLAEKIEAVILEVGIGGELDCTNIVPHTKTVGISSLGLEHTELLGQTLEEIAWQKAGIIKPKSTVYTSVTQPECLNVIRQRAEEKGATLHIVPDFQTYFEHNQHYHKLRDSLNNIIVLNGSLAIQLAYDWLTNNRKCLQFPTNRAYLSEQAVMGLLNCNWPARCQLVKFFNFNMYLDGAHTVESMQVCGDWFSKSTRLRKQPKVLIFNVSGDRNSKALLTILRNFSQFDLVCFGPNIATTSKIQNQDNLSVLHTQVEQLKRVQKNSQNWEDLCRENGDANRSMAFPSIIACFQHIRKVYSTQEVDILVTGSLHLIGATIISLNELGKDLSKEHN